MAVKAGMHKKRMLSLICTWSLWHEMIIIDKEVDEPERNLVCQRCGHTWPYKGHNPFFTLCPRCRTTVRTRKNKSLRPLKVGRPQASTAQITTPIGDDELQE